MNWPAPLIDVRIGGVRSGGGELVPVKRVVGQPDYFVNSGYDISLLELSRNASGAPTRVANDDSLWTPSTLEAIVGWGTTSEGGDTPDRLQEAEVPITADAYCGGAYDDFDATTMVCAGFGEGCARPGKPGVYARVADDVLREWVRGVAPAGVD